MSESIYDVYGGKDGYLEQTKRAWQRAGGFPIDKENVYPEHKIAQEFDSITRKVVLEYGCGVGSDMLSYLKRGNYVVAVDITPENVDTARKNAGSFGDNADFFVLDKSDDLPFVEKGFDVFNMHGVLMHIVEPEPVLRELYRVLKHGGLGYVMLYTEFLFERAKPNIEQWMKDDNMTQEQAFCQFTDGPGSPYARYYTEQEGKELLESVGFEVLSTYIYNNGDFRCFRLIKK